MSAFSDNLKQLRKERKLTQSDLSEAIGLSKSSINMYERGEREPDIQRILEIARFFDVSTDTLLGFERKQPIGENAMCACHGDEKDGAAMGWVSVRDRLPEKNGCYLVAVRMFQGGFPTETRVMGMDFNIHEFYNLMYTDTSYQVTHWMPIPEPPEED